LNYEFKKRLEAKAFNVLTCLLNVVGENLSYFATFEQGGRAVSKTGMYHLSLEIYTAVRVFKNLITDIQIVYGDAKDELLKSLVRFDRSLHDAGLLMLGTLLGEQEGLSPLGY